MFIFEEMWKNECAGEETYLQENQYVFVSVFERKGEDNFVLKKNWLIVSDHKRRLQRWKKWTLFAWVSNTYK